MTVLSKLETITLAAWKGCDFDDFGYLSFDQIADRSGLDRSRIRRFVRALARKGVVQFERGLWSCDGRPRGAGYGLTQAGIAELEKLESKGGAT